MTTLRLAIDASGMRTGAQDAVRVLDEVKRSAVDTGKALEQSFTFSRGNRLFVPDRLFDPIEKSARQAGAAAAGMGQQFGVAIESLSIGNRVRALTGEFQALSLGMGSASTATFLVGQSLLDVSQIMVRMKQAAGPQGFFSGLFGRLLANPLVGIVTILGAASAAMALFGNTTDKAAESAAKLGDAVKAMQAARQEAEALSRIGLETSPSQGLLGEARRLAAEGSRIGAAGERVDFDKLAELMGVRGVEAERYLGSGQIQYQRGQGAFGDRKSVV